MPYAPLIAVLGKAKQVMTISKWLIYLVKSAFLLTKHFKYIGIQVFERICSA